MTNYIIVLFVVISTFFSFFNGNISRLSQAVIESGSNAVETVFKLLGAMAMWGGIMKVAQASGLTDKICRIAGIPMKILFPGLDKKSEAFSAITMNITANLLGLGNAATPLGISAMKKLCNSRDSARNMAMLTVINSASIQLIPMTVAALRHSHGSTAPWDFLPSVLIVSAISLIMGCVMISILYTVRRKHYENI